MNNISELKIGYNIREMLPGFVSYLYSEKPGYKKLADKLPLNYSYLKFIATGYSRFQYDAPVKHQIYNLYKTLFKEKAFEIFENRDCALAFKNILYYAHLWNKRAVFTWEKSSRNPHKQIEKLIEHLFCKYELPKFLFKEFYSKDEMNAGVKHIDWIMHLGLGKSARNLKGIEFNFTKKMAHYFINAPEELNVQQALIYSIAKNANCPSRLIPYLYIEKIEKGIVSTTRYLADKKRPKDDYFVQKFWASAVEYLSIQGMFDYEVIHHLIDYVSYIKFNNNMGRGEQPEKPDFEFGKKNLQTLINEADKWTDQLNRLARAANLVRRVGPGRYEYRSKSVEDSLKSKWAGLKLPEYIMQKKGKNPGNKSFIYKIVELTSGEQLLEEGRALVHCVFSYAGSCINGSKNIFSLSDNINGRLVTIELTNRSVVQVKGRRNRVASAEEINIIKGWAQKHSFQISAYLRW